MGSLSISFRNVPASPKAFELDSDLIGGLGAQVLTGTHRLLDLAQSLLEVFV